MPPKKRTRSATEDDSTSQLELGQLEVSQLRTELERRGLEADGGKDELVARLEDALKDESR